jgi:MFS family permease
LPAGAVWAAYELATLLLFFETIPSEKRVGMLTVFNLANAGAVVVGSALGGAMLAVCGASRGAYLAVFVVSALARAAAVVALVRMPRGATSMPAAATEPLPQPVLRQPRGGTPPLQGPHWRRGHVPAPAAGPQRPAGESLPPMPG